MRPREDSPLLLISGLSVGKPTSFARQLHLLAGVLRERGWKPRVLGTSRNSGAGGDQPPLSAKAFSGLIRRTRPVAAILLGYRDQFPFISTRTPIPVFLWAQTSSVPVGPPPYCTAVPLTDATAVLLAKAGWALGPTIPHGVDTRLFRPSADLRRRPHGKLRLLSVGANTPRKRFDRLLDAYAIASDSAATRQFDLTIKTDRPTGGFDLRRAAQRPGVQVTVSELDDDEMVRLYRDHDLYLHAAEWEGFGIPVVEAMSCGVPVICPEGQGPGELVPYHDLLVETDPGPADVPESVRLVRPASLADRILAAAEDTPLRRRLGALGRVTATRDFDVRVVGGRWDELLSSTR